jgi:predicted enzyme related to lactoylglutathione lyase
MATQQLNAKLVFCSVPTKNTEAAQKFYDTLLGGEDFARSLNDKVESYFRPISQDGLTLSITPRYDEREPITCFFAVDDLKKTVSQLEAAGGKVVVNSTEMPASGPPQALMAAQEIEPATNWGQFVTMLDPDGNYLGLMQLEESAQSTFNARKAQRKLSKAQVDKQERWKKRGDPLMKKK